MKNLEGRRREERAAKYTTTAPAEEFKSPRAAIAPLGRRGG
jgi:hypothetical protein